MKNKVQDLLKGVKTKKAVVEAVNHIHPKELTEEGKSIVSYLTKLFQEDMKDMKLSEMKDEVLTLLDANSFRNMANAPVIFENAIKKKVTIKKTTEEPKEPEVSEEEAEALLNAMKKKDSKSKKDNKKTEEKPSEDKIFHLVGYRYTYPVFPETFTSPVLEGKTFHRIDEDDPMKIQALYDAMVEGKGDDIVIAMYFPDYERDYDIDPHAVISIDTNKKQMLKKYGGKFPNSLDVQSIVHFDGTTKVLASVSAFTGLPYAISCRPTLFVTNDTLHCRVTQNGLDYQFYQVK